MPDSIFLQSKPQSDGLLSNIDREVDLISDGVSEFWNCAYDALINKPQRTAAEAGVSMALGAAIVRFGGGASPAKTVLRTLGMAATVGMATDLLENGATLSRALGETWHSDQVDAQLAQRARSQIGSVLFDTAFNAAFVGAGMKVGYRLSTKPLSKLLLPWKDDFFIGEKYDIPALAAAADRAGLRASSFLTHGKDSLVFTHPYQQVLKVSTKPFPETTRSFDVPTVRMGTLGERMHFRVEPKVKVNGTLDDADAFRTMALDSGFSKIEATQFNIGRYRGRWVLIDPFPP